MTSVRAIRLASYSLVAAVFVACCLRAARQALTLDESITFQLYVAGPWQLLVLAYDANHHILHSLLCRLSAAAFGTSELALRLPSLLAGLACLLLARALTVGAHATPWALLGLLLAVGNPFVVDYLSLARGYSLALALFLSAMVSWLRLLRAAAAGATRLRLLLAIGAQEALAVFANLAFAVPLLVLTGVGFTLLLRLRAAPWLGTAWSTSWRLLAPALLVALLLGLPLVNARPYHFYFGTTTLYESAYSLVAASLDHRGHLAEAWPAVLAVATWTALAAAAGAGLAAVAVAAHLRRGSAGDVRLRFVIAGGIGLGSGLAWALLHFARGVPWPRERTGLVFAPCFAFAAAFGLQLAAAQPRWRRPALAGAAVLAALGLRFLAQPWTGPYRTWKADAGAARVHAVLRTFGSGQPDPVPVFCADRQLASLVYYDLRFPASPPLVLHEHAAPGVHYRLAVINPVFTPVERDGELGTAELPELGRFRGRVVFEDPVSRVVVLARE